MGLSPTHLLDNALRRAAEQALEGIWCLDEVCTSLFVNARAAALLGCLPEAVTGQPLVDFVFPEDWAALLAQVKSASSLQPVACVQRFRRANGSPVWASLAISADRDAAGRGVLAFTQMNDITAQKHAGPVQDITDRKRLEAISARNEQVLRLFVDHAPAAIAMLDRDMRYLAYSRRYLQDYRLPDENLVGRSHYEVFPDLPARWKEVHQHCLSGAIERCDEDPFPREDGSLDWVKWDIRPWYEAAGEIGGILLSSEVITYSKLAEDQLRKSEARYHTLFEQSTEGIFVCDGTGCVVAINPAGCALLGKGAAEIIGRPLHGYVLPAGPMDTLPDSGQVLIELKKGRVVSGERRVKSRDGTGRSIEVNARMLADGSIQIIARDISDRKKAEHQAKLNEKRLRSLQAILHYEAKNPQDLLDFALTAAIEMTESKIGYIFHYSETTQQFTLNTWSDAAIRECSMLEPQTIYALEKTGLWGEVVRQRQPIILNDFQADNPLKKGYPPGHIPLTRFLSLPVFSDQQIVAVIGMANKASDYDQTDLLQLSLLMEAVWKIVERKKTEEDLRVQSYALNAAANAIVITDVDGITQWSNPAFTTLSGFSAAEAYGKKLGDLVKSGRYDLEFYAHMWAAIRRGEVWHGELVNRRKDGSEYDEEMTISPLRSPDGKITQFIAIKQDISARKQAAAKQRQLEEKFSKAFHTSPDAININRLSDGKYIEINQGFLTLTGYHRSEVIGKTSLELNIWANPQDRERLVARLREHGEVSNLEAPFRVKDGSVKVCLMSASQIETNGELCILSITRDITERKQAEELLRKTMEDLREAYEATLQGWSNALEMRERETAGHSKRVVQLTLALAQALGVSEDDLVHIRRGALLHDIGKMGIPDSILLKPSPLSADEWVIMRQHPLYAYRLLSKIPYLKPALDIPYGHHEHWDGSGYPLGLAGEQIPLAARIFSIVDVWDALLSDRPYRPAWTEPAVARYLQDQSAKQFDPEVVKVFLTLTKNLAAQ